MINTRMTRRAEDGRREIRGGRDCWGQVGGRLEALAAYPIPYSLTLVRVLAAGCPRADRGGAYMLGACMAAAGIYYYQ